MCPAIARGSNEWQHGVHQSEWLETDPKGEGQGIYQWSPTIFVLSFKIADSFDLPVYVINGERIIFVDFWIGYVGQYHRWKRCNAGDVYGFLTIFIFSIKITDSFGLRRLCNKWVGFIFAGLGNWYVWCQHPRGAEALDEAWKHHAVCPCLRRSVRQQWHFWACTTAHANNLHFFHFFGQNHSWKIGVSATSNIGTPQ